MYTSLKLSKLLQENGFEGESDKYYGEEESIVDNKTLSFQPIGTKIKSEKYKKYDILNDLCVKYAKEMFGEELLNGVGGLTLTKSNNCGMIIISLLQGSETQEEAEEYLFENCLFNPKNK